MIGLFRYRLLHPLTQAEKYHAEEHCYRVTCNSRNIISKRVISVHMRSDRYDQEDCSGDGADEENAAQYI
jgi:hypothetical protein